MRLPYQRPRCGTNDQLQQDIADTSDDFFTAMYKNDANPRVEQNIPKEEELGALVTYSPVLFMLTAFSRW